MPRYVKVTRAFEFQAGHRLPETYEGNCKSIHGHNYKVEVTVIGLDDQLDQHGMLLDFYKFKEHFGKLIDHHLDHAFLYSDQTAIPDTGYPCKTFKMPEGMETTAECIGLMLFDLFRDKLKREAPGLNIHNVRIYETDRSWVDIGIQGVFEGLTVTR